ncbi:peptide chain release factor N(5)-glutamine methyltransferase [Pseudomonadota bacterium]
MKAKELLAEACRLLAGKQGTRLEAEVLLSHSLGVNRAWLYANAEQDVAGQVVSNFLQLIQRRLHGEPVAYLTGVREFWSLNFKVTPDVLIPRAETELLVETALKRIPADARWRIADLGTGSGAVALAIAFERPTCEVFASDISPQALSIAQQNADSLNLGQVHFLQGSWLSPLEGTFNGIVSNPPYVAKHDPHLKQGDCRFEPGMALSPGTDAMTSIRHIAEAALPYLETGGFLAFEHGCEQGEASRQLLLHLGYTEVETINDLAGLERVTTGEKA